jgi:hypothetical protein
MGNLTFFLLVVLSVFLNYRRAKKIKGLLVLGVVLAVFLNFIGVAIFYFATRKRINPADMILPDVIPTGREGLSLRKANGEMLVDINIVGESFRIANIAAVAKAANGQRFEIYLVAEPTNQYDENAVAVYAANLHIGYIGKPANKQWAKWVSEALQRGELLWGTAKAITRTGADNTGIFGGIYMPKLSDDLDSITSAKLTDLALGKAIDKVVALSNTSHEPETVAQLRSLSKKAAAVARPLAAHALWVQKTPVGQDEPKWNEVLSSCQEIFDNASAVVYATDEDDVDMLSGIEELADLVISLRPIGG